MESPINTGTTTTAGLGALPLRVGARIIFAGHGAQKLFGWFGGYGLVLLVMSAALVVRGAGSPSVDRPL